MSGIIEAHKTNPDNLLSNHKIIDHSNLKGESRPCDMFKTYNSVKSNRDDRGTYLELRKLTVGHNSVMKHVKSRRRKTREDGARRRFFPALPKATDEQYWS